MENIQEPGEIAEKAASVSSSSEENGHIGSDHHTVADDHGEGIPVRKRQRQPRTCFSSLEIYELERAFKKSSYLTAESCVQLQELGIPKRTIRVWFKNRRVKSKKQMSLAAKFRPLISANKSTILQPTYYSLNEVPWPGRSADGFISGMALPVSDGSWSRDQSSSMYTYHDSSPGSFETTALSYGSSRQQPSNYSNVSRIDNIPYLTASVPLDYQGDQRVPEGNIDLGLQQWEQQWDQRNGPSPSASWNQNTETSHSVALMDPPQASVHELEYTSLLDDVMAVVKQDLAIQNDKANPSFLGNVPNMQ